MQARVYCTDPLASHPSELIRSIRQLHVKTMPSRKSKEEKVSDIQKLYYIINGELQVVY